jgi:hypothetical protein
LSQIRICTKKQDPDPHQSEKLDPHSHELKIRMSRICIRIRINVPEKHDVSCSQNVAQGQKVDLDPAI